MAAFEHGFPQFAALPKELRLHVWDATMDPKLLRVGIGDDTKSLVSAWSPQRNPIALSVCAESRARALGFYTMKVPIYKYHEKSALRFAVRYIDPEHDLILVDSSFRSAASGNWGRMNGDFNFLKSSVFKVKEVVGYSQIRIKTAIRRLALPRRWWQFRCLSVRGEVHGYMWGFAHRFFTEFREIYIIQDFEDEQSQHGSDMVGCTGDLDSLLPVCIRADLQSLGWNVEVERDALKVTRSDSEHSTRIQDFSQGNFTGMDLTTIESVEKNSFFRLAPDVVYYMPRTCMPAGPRRRVAVPAQQLKNKEEDGG